MAELIDTTNLKPKKMLLSNNTDQNIIDTQSGSRSNSVAMTGRSAAGVGTLPFGEIDTSFKTIYNDLFRFRKVSRDKSAGIADQLMSAMDQPGHFYFKLFFYFSNPYSDPSDPLSSNLLGTKYTRENASGNTKPENTALNYLYNNREYTRFGYLSEFIQLLSDVSTKSPWYFQQITGLDQAVDRTEIGRDFKIEEERKTITIKCLPDAYDNRIGRLLDLYRAAVWSQNLKKWIVPKNLRKFDMGIYIFNSPIKTLSGGRYGLSGSISDRVLETTFSEYYGSEDKDAGVYAKQMYSAPASLTDEGTPLNSKYIELRGCEIDINSSKSVYAELDNAEGHSMEYEINIRFDSAVEDRYDPVFRNYIGDFVIEDLMKQSEEGLRSRNPYSYLEDSDKIVEQTAGDPFGAEKHNSIVGTAIGAATGWMNTFVNKLLLGNIYGFSFSKLDNLLTQDPLDAATITARGVNNASLIYKRITDFTDPDKGARTLAGKTLSNGWVQNSYHNEIPKKFPDYPVESDMLSGDLPKKLPDYPAESEMLSGDLPKKLPDYPVESDMLSGDLPKKLPDYPGESEMLSGDLPKKFPGTD